MKFIKHKRLCVACMILFCFFFQLCTSSLLLSFTSQEITELLASLPCQYEKDGVLIRLTKAWLEHDPDSRRQAVPQV